MPFGPIIPLLRIFHIAIFAPESVCVCVCVCEQTIKLFAFEDKNKITPQQFFSSPGSQTYLF